RCSSPWQLVSVRRNEAQVDAEGCDEVHLGRDFQLLDGAYRLLQRARVCGDGLLQTFGHARELAHRPSEGSAQAGLDLRRRELRQGCDSATVWAEEETLSGGEPGEREIGRRSARPAVDVS